MSEQLKTALLRAVGTALTAALVAGGVALLQGQDWRNAGIVAVGAAGATILGRGAVEGVYDGRRAAVGKVTAADVKKLPGPPA